MSKPKLNSHPGLPPGIYQHFKGNRYQVFGTARDSETEEEYVVYQALYGDFGTWIRPLSMFTEVVEREGRTQQRFAFVAES